MSEVTRTAKATVDTVLGQPVTPAIEFEYSWTEPSDIATAKASSEWLDDKEIFKVVKQNLQRNALSAKRNEVLKDRIAAIQNSPEFKQREMVKAIRALYPNMTDEEIAARLSA